MNQATLQPVLDGLLAQGLEQERLAGPGRPADHQVLPPADPFQGAQRLLGGGRDRGRPRRCPGVEGLPGGERRRGPAGGQRGAFPAGGLLGQQRPQHLGRFPALRLGGGDHLGGVAADVRQPQPAQQRLQVVGQRRRRRHPGCGHRRAGGGCGRGGHGFTSRRRASAPSAAQPAVPWVRTVVLTGLMGRACAGAGVVVPGSRPGRPRRSGRGPRRAPAPSPRRWR